MDQNTTEHSNCLHCGDAMQGRSDKKFCDDKCRNTYNNKKNHGKLTRFEREIKKGLEDILLDIDSRAIFSAETKTRLLLEKFNKKQ